MRVAFIFTLNLLSVGTQGYSTIAPFWSLRDLRGGPGFAALILRLRFALTLLRFSFPFSLGSGMWVGAIISHLAMSGQPEFAHTQLQWRKRSASFAGTFRRRRATPIAAIAVPHHFHVLLFGLRAHFVHVRTLVGRFRALIHLVPNAFPILLYGRWSRC